MKRNTRRRYSVSNVTIMTVLHKFKKILLVSNVNAALMCSVRGE